MKMQPRILHSVQDDSSEGGELLAKRGYFQGRSFAGLRMTVLNCIRALPRRESARMTSNCRTVSRWVSPTYSGSVTLPFTWNVPAAAGAPVPGWPPPMLILYWPFAMIGSPASVTILRSRGFSSKWTACDFPGSRCTR